MKKCHKSGFTLVEAILAVAIIGTIAALVLPPLISGAQNKKHAAALGRSVELVETGCQSLVQAANENASDGEFEDHFLIKKKDINTTVTSTDLVVANSELFDNATEYFGITPLSNNERSGYIKLVKSFNGGTPSPEVSNIAAKFAKHPKLGAFFGVKYIIGSETPKNDHELIYIDVNGASSPNRYGRDIFLFNLTNDCHMIPAGSALMTQFVSTIPTDGNGCSGHTVTNGLSCTSRVVKDGYKIEYMK